MTNNQISAKDAVHGLSCPRCGGMVIIPEGQIIVICPYCDQRSIVAAAKTARPAPVATPPTAPPASFEEMLGKLGSPENRANLTPEDARALYKDMAKDAAKSMLSGGLRRAANQNIQEADFTESGIGVRRYQAPLTIDRDQALHAFKQFLSGKIQIARDAASLSKPSEVFLVHLPFWGVWGKAAAYAFGQVKVGSGDNSHYEAREKRIVREMTWNCPACEVGEFGVRQVSLDGCALQTFNADALHHSGMVFEPVGAEHTALEAARASFEDTVRGELQLDRTAQLFTRLLRPRLGLVYYPLWVVRYLYKGRSFQVVVDGVNGQVLYGKAPGSVTYRAGVLVGGMAAGAITAIDVPALILSSSSHSSKSDNSGIFALIVFVVGLALMYSAYRTYRYAEHYEYHRYGAPKGGDLGLPLNLPGNLRNVGNVISTLEKFQ